MKTVGLLLLACLSLSWIQEKARLDIEISPVRSTRGEILLSLYTAENQYPYQPFRTYVIPKDSLRDGLVRTRINDLPPGQYGLCLLDDENRSGQMENNALGLPAEGYGFANNVKPFLRRPDYSRIQFRISAGNNLLKLIIRY